MNPSFTLVFLLGLIGLDLFARCPAAEITADFNRTNGVVRPLHGVNLGPLCYRGTVDLSRYHRELAIPLTRLHDVVWVNAEAVDIHTVFPDNRNDPENPENYTFLPTDDYIQAIVNVGSQIVYRLGESIEHTGHKYHVHPPADPAKWAAICLGIIRHYNEGWANGFHLGIRYWEIWNEPDVRPAMWTGTDADYFRLYEVTANAIKARFPELKVGGPALGGTGHFLENAFQPSPFLTNFLSFCQSRRAPLDFFSWHRYTSQPWDLPLHAQAVRRLLDQAGFIHTESHLNEWNFLPNDDWHPLLKDGQGPERTEWFKKMNGAAGAAFAASALITFQDAPLDAANYYTGEIQGFGLFDFEGTPKQTFYAFKAFREMVNTPTRVTLAGGIGAGFAALGGVSPTAHRAALLLSNFNSTETNFLIRISHLPWNGPAGFEAFAISETNRLDLVRKGTFHPEEAALSFNVPAPGVLLVKLSRGRE